MAAGLAIIGLVVGSMGLRGVDPVEIVATAAFAPIFVAALGFGLKGGTVTAGLAAGGYLLLRRSAIGLVGWAPLSGLLTTRLIGFITFGVVGGWAADVVKTSLNRLVLFDELDDATGLGNARSFLSAIERERRRSARYAGVFSVVHASFVEPPGTARAKAQSLRSLGMRLSEAARESDHLVHFADSQHHLLLVLPETEAEGATVVATNLKAALIDWGITAPAVGTVTVPGDEAELDQLETTCRLTIEQDIPGF